MHYRGMTTEEAQRALQSTQEAMHARDARNREIEAAPHYSGYLGSDEEYLTEELHADFADRVSFLARLLGL